MSTGLAKLFGDVGNDSTHILKTTNDGNIIIAGEYKGKLKIQNHELHEDSHGSNTFIAKLTPDGNVIWINSYGRNRDNEIIYDVAESNDNGFYFVGTYQNQYGFYTGEPNFNDTTLGVSQYHSWERGFIGKLDQQGNLLWLITTIHEDGSLNNISSVKSFENKTVIIGEYRKNLEIEGKKIVSPFGDYSKSFFVGEMRENGAIDSLFDVYELSNLNTSHDIKDLFIGKNGDIFVLSHTTNSRGGSSFFVSIVKTNGDVNKYELDDVVLPNYKIDDYEDGSFILTSQIGVNNNYFIAKYSNEGQIIWKYIGDENDPVTEAKALDNGGAILITQDREPYSNYRRGSNTYKFDNNGNIEWSLNDPYATFRNIEESPEGDFYIAGELYPTGSSSGLNYGGVQLTPNNYGGVLDLDIILLKLNQQGQWLTPNNSTFYISGIAETGNVLTIEEDALDSNGRGSLIYSWQTSSDESNWTVVGTNSTYTVLASEEGKKVKAIVSYKDSQGIDKTVTSSTSSIAYFDDGDASFSISGTTAVGQILTITQNSDDPDGNGIISSYSWQTSPDESNWTVVGTDSTYKVLASEEGKKVKAIVSYKDSQGFEEIITTSFKSIQYNLPSISGPSGNSGDSTTAISINENLLSIYIFSADESVTWSISGGVDKDLFTINSNTGLLSFKTAPDYESPKDTDKNNSYLVKVRATDTLGNSSEQTLTALVTDIDDIPPAAPSSLSTSSLITNSKTPTIFGISEVGSLVKLYNGSVLLGSASTDGNGAFSITSSTLSEGSYSLITTATDAAGNTSSGSTALSITVDTTAPIAPTLLTTSNTLTDLNLKIIGIAEAGSTVKLYNGSTLLGSASTDGNGAFFITPSVLGRGNYSLTATATDNAGNTSSASSALSITVETTAPTLSYLEALKYIASNSDLIRAFGIDTSAAAAHYTNHGKSEGRSLTSFSAADYLAKYSDLSTAFGNNETLALQHYIQSGYAEGRTASGSSSSSPTPLSDFEALNYIASYSDLISVFGTNTSAASSHYVNSGYAEGRAKDNFDEWGYLASNNDLMGVFGSNTTEAIKHYISYGKSEGRSTNIFNADSYLNNYADLKNAFGNDHELAKKHYVENGFNEGRFF